MSTDGVLHDDVEPAPQGRETMSGDYVTLAVALVMAYQIRAPLGHLNGRKGVIITTWLMVTLVVIALVPHLSFNGIQIGWLVSGSILMVHASRRVRRATVSDSLGPALLDAAGGWSALILAGSTPLAITTGAVAGLILPLGMGPWPGALEPFLEPLEAVLMGSVGLRALLRAGLGPEVETWPFLILSIPWLIIWDVGHVWRNATRPTR